MRKIAKLTCKTVVWLIKTLSVLLAVGFTCLFLLAATMIILAGIGVFDSCVRLPNGVIISRDSFFNFSKPYFGHGLVVQGPDGTVFSRGNDDGIYFSATTVWWVDQHPGKPPQSYEGLAYRPDVGLVSSWQNPELRKKLKREAGELLEEGKKLNNTNVLGALMTLHYDPTYGSRECYIPLFTFKKSYP